MYLNDSELKATYYPRAANMEPAEVTVYLQRANSYAFGVIGGVPNFAQFPPTEAVVWSDGLKAAVALAFEYFTRGETAQVNKWNGDITQAAPAGYFQRPQTRSDEMDRVDKMLKPYADLYDSQSAVPDNSRGIMFL